MADNSSRQAREGAIPEGVAKRREALAESGRGVGPDGDETPSRTDSLGRFVTANQNPFPVPDALRGGEQQAAEDLEKTIKKPEHGGAKSQDELYSKQSGVK